MAGVTFDLAAFVRESNRIEGILRNPSYDEIVAHREFLSAPPTVARLERFVSVVQPGAELRRNDGMNVRVGNHIAPPGGANIERILQNILDSRSTPFMRHHAYETLHPFMDGNGRSGRALWLWDMGGIEQAPLGFLHHFYYQTLQESR